MLLVEIVELQRKDEIEKSGQLWRFEYGQRHENVRLLHGNRL